MDLKIIMSIAVSNKLVTFNHLSLLVSKLCHFTLQECR